MVLGGVTEAGLWQSAVLMTDLKGAYLVQASPRIMFYAQLLGSLIGALVGSGIYRFLTVTCDIPSLHFPIPFAHMWVNTARLVNGGTLPQGVALCGLIAFLISACLCSLSLAAAERSWRVWVPSGVGLSMGTACLI